MVHVELEEDETGRRRYVAEVAEICGVGEGGRVATNLLYAPGADGRAAPTGTSPARLEQLVRAGFDRSWLGAATWRDHSPGVRPLAVLPGSDT